MNLVMGSSSFLQSPLYFPASSSFSSFYSQSSAFLCMGNGRAKRRNRVSTMACMRREAPKDDIFSKRRVILLVGISVLPLLKLRANALEGSASSRESRLNATEESQKSELAPPSNPFVSLLNGLGICGTGVLGALYALTQNEKKNTEAAIESMEARLKEKEAALVSMEKEFESKLLNAQQERTKQIKTAKEEQQSLMNQLTSANTTISLLGHELKNEKRSIELLRVQIDTLQTNLSKSGEEKRALEEELKQKLDMIESLQDRINLISLELKDKDDRLKKLSSSLEEKEVELTNLNSIYERTKDQLAKADLEIKALTDQLLKNNKELELKNFMVDELDARVSSLLAERDDLDQKIDAVQKEYEDLKLSSENKAASDAKLLKEREEELHQLKKKLEFALDEANENQATIAALTQGKEDLREMLNGELSNVKNLKHDLQITRETLGKTRNEASDLAEQLHQSKNYCVELESELSRIQAEFAEAKQKFQNSLDEAKRGDEVLASEVTAARELLKKTSEELQTVTCELEATSENRDSLKRELVAVYKKAEATANDLKEEKQIVSSLNKEIQAFEMQILKDKDARKSLETDLEEATKSLDEMNQNALTLSRNLEKANSLISRLEDEKEVLYKSLTDQKNIAQESQENMEDAHDLVMRLGKERESLDKRAKKLEEELASAKGEILRLRSQINSSKTLVDDKNPQKAEDKNNVSVSAKKGHRRRKANSQ